MRYNVTIMETLARTVQVEAGSETEAELAVRSMYRVGGFVLTADDYVTTEFRVEEKYDDEEIYLSFLLFCTIISISPY